MAKCRVSSTPPHLQKNVRVPFTKHGYGTAVRTQHTHTGHVYCKKRTGSFGLDCGEANILLSLHPELRASAIMLGLESTRHSGQVCSGLFCTFQHLYSCTLVTVRCLYCTVRYGTAALPSCSTVQLHVAAVLYGAYTVRYGTAPLPSCSTVQLHVAAVLYGTAALSCTLVTVSNFM
jgi:hypothetical protein